MTMFSHIMTSTEFSLRSRCQSDLIVAHTYSTTDSSEQAEVNEEAEV